MADLDRLSRAFDDLEAMRKSILAWLDGKPTREGWVFPHGCKELREALKGRKPMTGQEVR